MKPQNIPAAVPIVRVHFFATKERLMQVARDLASMTGRYAGIQVFADLSPATLAFSTITKALKIGISDPTHHPQEWIRQSPHRLKRDTNCYRNGTFHYKQMLLPSRAWSRPQPALQGTGRELRQPIHASTRLTTEPLQCDFLTL
ncbi:Hypothetical predicted protein [Pelobates cultripes]|uniref:Uncharacterized protein n=1 Tax=Pelobates cultripes TaxID=61616 RepID=A0AAD1SFH1_PELCU|nr:Hypothetical predicted protein [Pelobates cultripes]